MLLLDEPAAGLDPEARYELGMLFARLRERGMTLLVSSHILAELESYSTDMLILSRGRIVEQRRLGDAGEQAVSLDIAIVGDVAGASELLADTTTVESVTRTGNGLRCRFRGDAAARAALLARLVDKGIAVSQFAVTGEDLQESYLRSIRAAQGVTGES